jgi:hypothetical protein
LGALASALWCGFGQLKEQARQPAQALTPAESATLDSLTRVLRKYSFEQHRLPKSLDEVVTAGYVAALPTAPPGKKFVVDPKTVRVVLVRQ